MLLCNFTYLEKVEKLVVENNSSFNETNLTSNEYLKIIVTQKRQPDWLEYLILFWVISFFIEELRQVIKFFFILISLMTNRHFRLLLGISCFFILDNLQRTLFKRLDQ